MPQIESGSVWRDTAGQPINAHGGGFLWHAGLYYWYGEARPPGPSSHNAQIGISCYSSPDLLRWKNEGIVLPVNRTEPGHPLQPGCKMERPKVVYNKSARRFVLWWHHDLLGWGHAGALAGVAESDSPTGPFRFIDVSRPANAMFRDCTVYQDVDGSAHLVFATDDNANLAICRLADDYLKATAVITRVLPGRYMEAPCVFRHAGYYYLIGSDCTSWHPNEARSAIAPSLHGPWKEVGNPCLGEGAETTYGAQSTFVLPLTGKPGAFVFMADLWRPQNISDSRYLWLPLEFRTVPGYEAPRPFVRYRPKWSLDCFDRPPLAAPQPAPASAAALAPAAA